MGQQLSRDIALADVPHDWATFEFGGTDRIDVTALGNDVAIELRPTPGQAYQQGAPIIVSAATFESIAGLAITHPPRGVAGFRLYNANPGQQATARVKAFGLP